MGKRAKDTPPTISREKHSAVLNVMLVIYSVYAHGFYDTRKAQLKRNLQKRTLHELHTYVRQQSVTLSFDNISYGTSITGTPQAQPMHCNGSCLEWQNTWLWVEEKNYDHWAKEEGMKDTQGIGAVKNQPQHSPSWWRNMRTLIHLVTLSFLL